MPNALKSAVEFFKNKKLIVILILLGAGLILVSAFGGKNEVSNDGVTEEEYKVKLERELAELCSSVEGVGRCSVSVSFKPREGGGRGSSDDEAPEVLGVIVVCRGASSSAVRSELTRLFTSLYGIPSTRIAILKLN